jgi:hypothetical protein
MQRFFATLKEKSGRIGILIAVLTLAWSSIGGYVQSNTHLQDVQAQQEKRLLDLESQVRNDLATRREIEELKADTGARLDRIEDLLLRDLEGRKRKKPYR